uniref:Uncharacterized protein n=1 Tax=Anguilla anguilla TaxID=7936 RepID=A0A0E9REU2_ANGAN
MPYLCVVIYNRCFNQSKVRDSN